MIPDPAPPYDISTTWAANQAITRILTRASQNGLRIEAERWLWHMEAQLRFEPRSWGDPIRNFRNLKMIQFRGRTGPLSVYYSLHDRLPFVVLLDIVVDPDHILASEGPSPSTGTNRSGN